jgi:hypothetical protein
MKVWQKMANEERLIDANALSEAVNGIGKDIKRTRAVELACLVLIADAPTVDAVEVVRCKDCKHWQDSWVAPDGKHEHGYCHMEEADDVVVGRWDDDFCSYGERKDK